ncbi:MAG: asparagine synthetase B [Candidatus Wallbacteria bacterium]|nr:asparagine synthetase B [Candidatus Wallbacteria bacterium]
MSGMFGYARLDGAPAEAEALEKMRQAMLAWGPDGASLWRQGPAGLGQARLFDTPEARLEALPWLDEPSGVAFTAAARIDNRTELADALGLNRTEALAMADGELLRRAYLVWGTQTPRHVLGDWAFAAWHVAEQRLFLARDHFGITSLYYHASSQVFAFASDVRALLALGLAPVELDELYLAQLIVVWPAYLGNRTIRKSISRLPPAHHLEIAAGRLVADCYWHMEDVSEARLARRQDYVETFRDLFDEAVRDRLRSASPIASTLSGGLDSGSITATAARMLGAGGKRLLALTSAPEWPAEHFAPGYHADELPQARAVAELSGNVDLCIIRGRTLTPMAAMRSGLAIHSEPQHAAGNLFWLHELERTARDLGHHVLLTGQAGNGGYSWSGWLDSQPLSAVRRAYGMARMMRQTVKRAIPGALRAWWMNRNHGPKAHLAGSSIHSDFAKRLDLVEAMADDPGLREAATPLEARFRHLHPGRAVSGAIHAELGAAHELSVRDPTCDIRLLSFSLSIPDRFFIDHATGADRWLARGAMRERLPEVVRLGKRRGRQAADLVPRLRACAGEVEAALTEVERGPASSYVDCRRMREVWVRIQREDSPRAFLEAAAILTRGLMAGLFVNSILSGSTA